MKKKILLIIIIILIILVIPIPKKDNNKKEYKAILYHVIINDSEREKGTIIKLLGFEIHNTTEVKEDITIKSLDEFYNNELVKKYPDLRTIKKDYTEEEAVDDNCFVIGTENVYNDNLFANFFDNYENNKSTFIRVIEFTLEQDMLIYDILFDTNSNKLYIVPDNTRDRNAMVDIELFSYEKMTKYEYLNHTYWVLYNGELNKDTLFSEETFIVSYV